MLLNGICFRYCPTSLLIFEIVFFFVCFENKRLQYVYQECYICFEIKNKIFLTKFSASFKKLYKIINDSALGIRGIPILPKRVPVVNNWVNKRDFEKITF